MYASSNKLFASVAPKTEFKTQEYNFDDENITSADDGDYNEDNDSSGSNVDVSEMPKAIKKVKNDKTSEVALKTKTVRRKEKLDTTPIT